MVRLALTDKIRHGRGRALRFELTDNNLKENFHRKLGNWNYLRY